MKKKRNYGFALVELLIVVIILGLLAAIAIPIYTQQQQAAKNASSQQSLSYLKKAVIAAKAKTGRTLMQITGSGCTGCYIPQTALPADDPLNLPKTNTVWTAYLGNMQKISDASGMDVSNLVDGHGRPFFIDENEGENGNCASDTISVLADPFAGRGARQFNTSIPLTSPACT